MIKNQAAMVATLVLLVMLSAARLVAEEPPVIRVGHVGHDHHLALFVAAQRGESLRTASGGAWLRERKPFEVYELLQEDRVLATLRLIKGVGGSAMPSAVARGEIEVGLGGIVPAAFLIDQGAPLKIVAPLNGDGDMLMLRKGLPPTDWSGFLKLLRSRGQPLRIGYKSPKAVAYLVLREALKHEGIRYGPSVRGEDGQPVLVLQRQIR